MQLFGPTKFLFNGVIHGSRDPFGKNHMDPTIHDMLWKCLEHIDSHKSHLKRKIPVVVAGYTLTQGPTGPYHEFINSTCDILLLWYMGL